MQAADSRQVAFELLRRQAGDTLLGEAVLSEDKDGESVVGEGWLNACRFFLSSATAACSTS